MVMRSSLIEARDDPRLSFREKNCAKGACFTYYKKMKFHGSV